MLFNAIDGIRTPQKHYELNEQFESSCSFVALNIVEDKGSYSKKEFKQFLYIAMVFV